MADRRGKDQEPEVFDRLQRLAMHERRRRWDSTRDALANSSIDSLDARQTSMPSELVAERFEWLEGQITAMTRELRRVEYRSKMIALRARVAVLLGLITAIVFLGLATGFWHTWLMSF